MPWFVRLWTAKEGQEGILGHELLRSHQSHVAPTGSVLESRVYREQFAGRELLDLILYRDETAPLSREHQRLLDRFRQIGAAHAESRPLLRRMEVIREFSTPPHQGLDGMAAVFRGRKDHVQELIEALQSVADDIAESLSPTRVLVVCAAEDPGLLLFLGDSNARIDLQRLLEAALRRQRAEALEHLSDALSVL